MRFLALILLIASVLPTVFSQECSATKLCATGCCSKFGFCGTDSDHCSPENCVSTCDFRLGCDATKLCATGCCSKFGFCGTGPDFCSTDNCVSTCNFKLGCDESNPCAKGTGCCSKFGFCGLGPDYCAKDICVAGCDSKSYCDPGYGKEWSEVGNCPLNVCCSKWGFCGLTEEFCGTKTVKRPGSCGGGISRIVGYYEGWSRERPCHAFFPEQIPLGVYTHINFAFATIDPITFRIIPAAPEDVVLYRRLTDLKQFDPDLKVYIAVGGWTFNDPGQPTATTFSDIARSEPNQRAFAASLISFMATYNFDGVDLDWEYPGADDRNGRPEDFKNFPKFIANLKSALDSNSKGRNGLTVTIPASYWYLQHFDIVQLVKYVEWFNIMTYDLHGTWDKGNKWLGNFLNAHTNLTEITTSMDLLWRNDISPDKVVLGLAFYARAFTATSSSCMTPGCTFESGAWKGPCSGETSVLLNSELVDIAKEKNIQPVLYKDAAVKVLTWGDQWAAYDDEETFQLKADFARSQCLGGVMVWAISHDTPDGAFTRSLGKVLKKNFQALPLITDTTTTTVESSTHHKQCKWTDCGISCPAGWKTMIRQGPGTRTNENKHVWEYMTDESGCDGIGHHTLCCPLDENNETPICEWHGFNNGGGKCTNECKTGYVQVGSNSMYCNSKGDYNRYEVACCTTGKKATKLWEASYIGQCDSLGYHCKGSESLLAHSASGNGGAMCPKDRKSEDGSDNWKTRGFCMDTTGNKPVFTDCHDGIRGGFFPKGRNSENFCYASCPADKVRITLDSLSHGCAKNGGANTVCCHDNYFTFTTTTETITVEDPQVKIWNAAWKTFIESESSIICSRDAGRSLSQRGMNFSDPYTYDLFELPAHAAVKRAEKKPRDIVIELIWTAMFGTQSIAKTIMAQKVWDEKALELKYTNLVTEKLRAYWATFGPDLNMSPLDFLDRLFCNLASYNKIVGSNKKTLTCTPFALYSFDKSLQFDDETSESIYSISKSPPTRRSLDDDLESDERVLYGGIIERSIIDKRAGGARRTYQITLRDFAGNPHVITITSEPYHNGDDGNTLNRATGANTRFWAGNGDGGCTPAVIQTTATQAQIDMWMWVTEHILELQVVARFFELLVNGRTATGPGMADIRLPSHFRPVDLTFITANFQRPWASWSQSQSQTTPEQDLFNSVGSKTNPGHLVVAESGLNSYKGRVFSFDQPMAASTWKTMTGETYVPPESNNPPSEGYTREYAELQMTAMLQTIGIFGYLNQPAVANALRATYLATRAVWAEFDQALLASTPATQSVIRDIWQWYLQETFTNVYNFTVTWARARITELRNHWEAIITMDNDPGITIDPADVALANDVLASLQTLSDALDSLAWNNAPFR